MAKQAFTLNGRPQGGRQAHLAQFREKNDEDKQGLMKDIIACSIRKQQPADRGLQNTDRRAGF